MAIRKRRNSASLGRVRIALARLLAAQGIEVDPANLWCQQGAYRSPKWDLARWGGDGVWAGNPYNLTDPIHGSPCVGSQVHVSSWSTMTECVRYGIEVSPDRYNGWWMTDVDPATPPTPSAPPAPPAPPTEK